MPDARAIDDDIGIKWFLGKTTFRDTNPERYANALSFALKTIGCWAWYRLRVTEEVL